MAFVTRFAPSPTGPLHLGHAYSAILTHDIARAEGGQFVLRIEDIDRARSRPEWVTAVLDNLTWLGLTWDGPVARQSDRLPAYRAALDRLQEMEVLFGCTCTRGDIRAALAAPQEGGAVQDHGPDGPVYPGTCRGRPLSDAAAIRLDLARSVNRVPDVAFWETGPAHPGHHQPGLMALQTGISDIVLARRDIGTSYHLAVVVDDADQGITHVVRGEDLFDVTPVQVILQRLLGLPTPTYHHHRLIRDENGKRLAKRDDARALSTYRTEGATPADIRRMVGL
jgi:glutamyl-Q tRNA(Asp) synthetase